MSKKTKNEQAIALALTFSVIALVLSVFSSLTLINGSQLTASTPGADFDARVTQAIEQYIQNQQPKAQRRAETVPGDLEDDDAVKGDLKAPITLVEWSDYECPFCSRFFTNTLSQIDENYISTGKVKLIYRDFPLDFHKSARPAALAAECVREQGGDSAYFGFHDLVFSNQTSLDNETFRNHADALGVNTGIFDKCVAGNTFDEEITKDFTDGQQVGIGGTPGFILLMKKDESKIDTLKGMEIVQQGDYVIQYVETDDGNRMGLRISGAHAFETFQQAIDVGL